MSTIKEFYHDQICKMNEIELQKVIEQDSVYWETLKAEEDAQIIKRAEEMEHSEMPNFLR